MVLKLYKITKQLQSMSKFDMDQQEISRISFDQTLTQKEKNRLISRIESKMARFEQMELNGKKTGYFE